MKPPPSTIKKPAFGLQPGGEDTSAQPKKLDKKRLRGKVALGPGFSALDWNRLANSGRNLRGTDEFPMRVTLDELQKHNTKKDAWSVFNGKVYNITPYLPFHPGGEAELMRVAGRDGTKLFMLTHSWVNMEYMMQECMVGVLVRG
ncbi:cytochrome b5-like heme/steroid binding domain-containing protein [Naematelia encephala]|uniref:Cytochrome b5-like heme/steroid binding domain-containing protein n=1 Tax=Naematelia encephala TaxID=71784 RepID=A0A1Y2B7Y1_9TREE|nr:cytochrome b5-like heme/steroid binding domain-containing protein [Naematelia encephala]